MHFALAQIRRRVDLTKDDRWSLVNAMTRTPDIRQIGTTLLLLVIGALGAVLAVWLNAPTPFLLGPSACVTIAVLAGLPANFPLRLRDAIFVVVGVNVGTSVTPETVATAIRWPGSLVGLSVCVGLILVLGTLLLTWLFRMDRLSALLAATPGHLSYVISLSGETDSDVKRVTLVQSLRVLLLTLLVPFLAPLLSDHPPHALAPRPVLTLVELGLILVLSLGLGLILQRLKAPAALLLGGLGVSAVAQSTGLVNGVVYPPLATAAFVAMGTMIGTRFNGVTLRDLFDSLAAAATLTGLATATALVTAAATAAVLGLPLLNVVIAFAPGGLEVMMAMSILLDTNPAYVAAHHVFRLLFLTVALPFALSWVRRR